MGGWSKNLFLLSLIIFLYVSGILIFTKGFLLKRIVVEQNSSCQTDFSMQVDQHGEEGCWMHKRFRKAIIVVIDALRLDFLAYDSSISTEQLPFYKNKLPIVKKLISKSPKNARIYRFLADPPTTTLQRLKGLTTGSLPTFVDAGTNFASSDISEDNVIDQLIKHRRRIKFLGDDTWMSLFPGRFTTSFPFPSFNVKDLHTVDNGILKHLMPELKKRDWDVLIAHFLGVDHCGHRYGPQHPAMSEKLTQMNEMISNVTRQMGDDTVLFVLGDHGMTWTGDHGGDSREELEAGLFVYSTVQLTSSAAAQQIETVSQTDLVPTLALLLGVPIPFSNLGHIITDFFNHCPWWQTDSNEIKQDYHVVKALRLNAIQMSHYLDEYSKHSTDFPQEKLQHFSLLLSHTENELQKLVTNMVKDGETSNAGKQLKILIRDYSTYIKNVQETCRSIWAKFDILSITLGIMTILNAVFVNICLVMHLKSTTKSMLGAILSSSIFTGYALFQTFWIESTSASLMSFILGTVNLVICIFYIIKPKNNFNIKMNSSARNWILQDQNFVFVICGIYFLLFFSNSFVVYEDSIALFLTQTLIWVYCAKVVHRKLSTPILAEEPGIPATRRLKYHHYKVFDIMQFFTHPAMVSIKVAVFFSVCVRLSSVSRTCREEQVNCSHSVFLQPLTNLDHTSAISKNMRYFLSISGLAHSKYMTWHWFKQHGNLNGHSVTVLCVKYGFPAAAVFCAFHWCLQGLPNTILDTLPPWQQTLMARLVYIIIIVSIVSIIFNPLCVYLLPKEKDTITMPAGETSDEAVISQVYKQLRNKLKRQADGDGEQKESLPVVFGLGTVATAAVLYICVCVALLLNLLLGDGLGPSVLLIILCVVCFLELHAANFDSDMATGLSSKMGLAVITMSSLCTVFFYGTGHQSTVPSIRWEAAFTGFHGDFQYNIIPAILIQLNTFASEVIFTAAMPLLITWPFYGGVLKKMFQNKRESAKTWRGDLVVFDNEMMYQTSITHLYTYVFLFKGIKLLGSVCAAALHRRHLMVWKIFAPRFVFEVMSSITVFTVSVLMYVFLLRLYKALEKWTGKLDSS